MPLTMPLPVFYRPEMAVPVQSYSPSANKPRLVVEDWLRRCPEKIEVISYFAPLTRDELLLAHSADYIDGVLAGKTENGFGTRDPAIAQSCLYTGGSLMAAARHALSSPDGIACSPSSGFHHAHRDHAEGYCTFNSLALVALRLAGEGKRVGILDCDVHFGNGTVDILGHRQALGNKHGIIHYTVASRHRGGDWHQLTPNPNIFLEDLDTALEHFASTERDIVLYQAGADMHVLDPLGGFLHPSSMKVRDRRVFAGTARAGIPIAWNLAGGYRRDLSGSPAPVLATHYDTLQEALTSIAGWYA